MTHHYSLTFLDKNMHIESWLVSLVEGKEKLTASEQEHLLDHLIECVTCQITLRVCLEVLRREETRIENASGKDIGMLLSSLDETFHETLIQNDISEYIEAVEVEGENIARKRFPTLVRHIEECKICQADIAETLTLLHEIENTELMTPLQR